jgi:hypothetical protein
VLLILRFQLSNAAGLGNLDGQQVGSPLEMRPDTGKTLSRKTGVIPGDWTRREGDWGSRWSLQGQRLPSAASVEAVLPALLITIYHSHFQVPAWFMVTACLPHPISFLLIVAPTTRRRRSAWEHLDFAKVCCLMNANHRIRAPLARTLTPVGQPCDVGSTVPLPVSVGISRYRA